jgi:hypothetical protein
MRLLWGTSGLGSLVIPTITPLLSIGAIAPWDNLQQSKVMNRPLVPGATCSLCLGTRIDCRALAVKAPHARDEAG